MVCGGGTYVRTLCADIGAPPGAGGHMKALAREAVGAFRRAEALPLARLADEWPARLLPMESALRLPSESVSDEDAARLLSGQAIPPGGVCLGNACAAARGALRALARYEDGLFRPFRVLFPPPV